MSRAVKTYRRGHLCHGHVLAGRVAADLQPAYDITPTPGSRARHGG